MNNTYYLLNNPVMVIGVIEVLLQRNEHVDMARIAALLPILFDERMIEKILDDNIQYSFRQLIQQNNMFLANYNDRYLSLLNPFYQALSILIDADRVKLNGTVIEPSTDKSFSFLTSCESKRMKRIVNATGRILHLAEKETNKELYQLLKVAL